MKRNLPIIILLLILVNTNQLFAQHKKRCGIIEYMARLKAQDPTLGTRLQQMEVKMEETMRQQQNMRTASTNSVITVPVVFHILYNNHGDVSVNISQNRILDQLAVLNRDFARLNPDSNNTPVPFRSLAANTYIQFCLAKRDPNGDSTNGIIRKQVAATGFDPINDDNIKFSSLGGDDAWPSSDYLNIWVSRFDGNSGPGGIGLLGVTTLPTGSLSPIDGVVLLCTTIGGTTYNGTEPSYNLGRTLTHEVGHWFNLHHTWGDDDNDNGICEPPAECSGSDFVSDTPNQGEADYSCPTYPTFDCCTSNGNGVMFMNYMDYVDDNCMNLFTQGQSTRMHTAITLYRNTIPNSNGCLAPNGIYEINSQVLDLSVFPNPGPGSMTVTSTFNRNTDAIVTVSNVIGEIVFTKEFKNVSYVNFPVDFAEKEEGIYNLSLRTANSLVNRKIVLTR